MNNIISFHGADHKVGVTDICSSVSECISQSHPDISVLLVNADGEYGLSSYSFILDDRITESEIFNLTNDANKLKEKIKVKDNLFYLNLSVKQNLSYIPDMIEDMLTKLSDVFDIIIIDSGSSIIDGASLGSLFKSNYIYYVLNQTESSLRRIESISNLYSKLKLSFHRYIINSFSSNSIYDLAYITERLNLDKSQCLLIKKEKKAYLSESEGKSIFQYKPSRKYVKQINKISKEIITNAGL